MMVDSRANRQQQGDINVYWMEKDCNWKQKQKHEASCLYLVEQRLNLMWIPSLLKLW